MTIAPFWVTIALLAPRALAVLTGSTTISATSTATTAAPTCTASLTTTLCDYPSTDFSVAIESRASCWDYCNDHQPCNFVIFNPGNPYLGTGTCWLYPGETFDKSQASSDCSDPYLEVYDKPTCSGGATTTTTSGGCTATATPSAVASVCGYPAPEDCFYDCYASSGAPNCLSICAKADACSYVVFKPGQDSYSPYAPGTCWVYPNGTYDDQSTTTCSGKPEQYVYENLCPKPSSSSSSSSSSTTTGSAIAAAAMVTSTTSKNSAPTGISLNRPISFGMAALMWQAL
ncbi:hypothetical protein N7452_001326 [Penicillium brevicompactum]|uniref:Apple domain-containing protein n=1 Tax=Penicillium brevicompactum TaxID=5074 RepID=A0A9W9R258_PENBR|nr:hypothetical protein N7452_001326 [Penicillium brevicompactum]